MDKQRELRVKENFAEDWLKRNSTVKKKGENKKAMVKPKRILSKIK